MHVTIEVRRKGSIAVVRPEGRITFGEHSAAFKLALDEAIDAGAYDLIVDGSRIAYMDSTGIGEMVGALRRLMPSGGRLGIAAPSPKLREILDITGLDTVFVVSDSEESVRERLSALTP